MAFTDAGEAETVKGAVHGGLGVLALMCAAYNAGAWFVRRERHLAVNIGVYTALACFEVVQILRHRRTK